MPSPDAEETGSPPHAPHRATKIRTALTVNGAAVLLTLVVLAVLRGVFPAPPVSGPDGRLAYGAGLLVWPALVLLLMVFGVMAARGRALALNPIDDPESRGLRIAQRVLSNSVEQTAILVPALLALVVTIPLPHLSMAAVLTLVFVVGRLLFWIGYQVHPYARAPGMAATLTATIVTVVWAVVGALG